MAFWGSVATSKIKLNALSLVIAAPAHVNETELLVEF